MSLLVGWTHFMPVYESLDVLLTASYGLNELNVQLWVGMNVYASLLSI